MKKLFMLFALSLVASAAVAADPASFHVVVKGKGRPMILIPGLSSPGEVWDDTITRYSSRYECHRLTLSGFAGTKPIKGALLATVRRELAEYIRTKKLDHPIIVGHSLGGFLAFWLASTEPDLVGPVIAVDGLPSLAAVGGQGSTTEEIERQGEAMRSFIASQTPEQFAAQTTMSMAMMITGKEDRDRMVAAAIKSDPSTVGGAVKELLTNDLRSKVKEIKTPVLLIGAGGGMSEAMAKQIAAAYESQVASIADHRVVMAEKARHFVMLDDRPFFFATVDRFLAEKDAVTKGARAGGVR